MNNFQKNNEHKELALPTDKTRSCTRIAASAHVFEHASE